MLPAGAYSHTQSVPVKPGLPGTGHVCDAQPIRLVLFQTTCVKCPVVVPEQLLPVNPPTMVGLVLSKGKRFTSQYQLFTASLGFCPGMTD